MNLFQTTAQRANATNKTANSELTDPQDLNQFNERCAVILGVAKAEMNHFHDMRVKDFKDIFQSFISGQITFHEKMLEKLRAAQSGFE